MTVVTSDTQTDSPAAEHVPQEEVPEILITPRKGWIGINWTELFRSRELLYFLVWRDVKVRYKQTVLGVGWVILQPLISMVIFTMIFGNLAGLAQYLPEDKQHAYPVFVFVALVPWLLFNTSLATGGLSLINQQHLLTKIYLPRLFVPTSAVGGALVDMAISAAVLTVLMVIYGAVPGLGILLLPLLVLMTVIASLGCAYLLSALTVSYRDFRFLIPFMAQILMWVSFVAYPPNMLDEGGLEWTRPILAINPMFGLIGGYRAALFGLEWHWLDLAVSSTSASVIFLLGLFYFRKTERRFADIA